MPPKLLWSYQCQKNPTYIILDTWKEYPNIHPFLSTFSFFFLKFKLPRGPYVRSIRSTISHFSYNHIIDFPMLILLLFFFFFALPVLYCRGAVVRPSVNSDFSEAGAPCNGSRTNFMGSYLSAISPDRFLYLFFFFFNFSLLDFFAIF